MDALERVTVLITLMRRLGEPITLAYSGSSVVFNPDQLAAAYVAVTVAEVGLGEEHRELLAPDAGREVVGA